MTTALGVLGMREEDFWSTSYYPFSCAVNGYLASQGVRENTDGVKTRTEFLELVRQDKASRK